MTLKKYVNVTMDIILNCSIRWMISTSIKSYLVLFASSHCFQILNITWFPEIVWPWKYISRRRTTFALAPFDGKYLTSYLMALVMLALSLTICEIFAKILQCQSFDLEDEGHGQGVEELGWNVRFYIAVFFLF